MTGQTTTTQQSPGRRKARSRPTVARAGLRTGAHRAQEGRRATPGRVVRLGQLIQVRGEDVRGELYCCRTRRRRPARNSACPRGPAASSGRRGRAALGPGHAARGQALYGSDPALARGAEAGPGLGSDELQERLAPGRV